MRTTRKTPQKGAPNEIVRFDTPVSRLSLFDPDEPQEECTSFPKEVPRTNDSILKATILQRKERPPLLESITPILQQVGNTTDERGPSDPKTPTPNQPQPQKFQFKPLAQSIRALFRIPLWSNTHYPFFMSIGAHTNGTAGCFDNVFCYINVVIFRDAFQDFGEFEFDKFGEFEQKLAAAITASSRVKERAKIRTTILDAVANTRFGEEEKKAEAEAIKKIMEILDNSQDAGNMTILTRLYEDILDPICFHTIKESFATLKTKMIKDWKDNAQTLEWCELLFNSKIRPHFAELVGVSISYAMYKSKSNQGSLHKAKLQSNLIALISDALASSIFVTSKTLFTKRVSFNEPLFNSIRYTQKK